MLLTTSVDPPVREHDLDLSGPWYEPAPRSGLARSCGGCDWCGRCLCVAFPGSLKGSPRMRVDASCRAWCVSREVRSGLM